MAEKITLARPYAKAVFDIALANKEFAEWSSILQILAMIAKDPNVIKALHNYTIPPQQFADFFVDIADKTLNNEAKNLIQLLALRRRLRLLPEISAIYERLRDEAEHLAKVEYVSATELSSTQKENVAKTLEKKLGKKVIIESRIDPDLMAGFVVHANDKVIDRSIKGQLSSLKEYMGG
jgi:F-type H+-transporting ATPase subunit delta